MKYLNHKVLKTALGTIISLYIAEFFKLNFGVTAGIVTIITIQGTKKESFKVAFDRFIASAIGLIISVLLFHVFGFTPVVFGVFVLLFMPICLRYDLFQGFLVTVVLVTHMLVIEDISVASILNEVYILLVGTVVALILNMYMPEVKEDILKTKRAIDDGMRRIISYFADVMVTGAIFVDEEKIFTDLRKNLDTYRELAFNEYNNDLINPSRYKIDLANMKKSQFKVLLRMRKHFYKFYISSDHAHMVADFARRVADSIGVGGIHNDALKELGELREKFRNMSLPQTRVEFESRAMFFQFLNDIEEFLEIKRDFLQKYTIKGEKINKYVELI